MHWLQRAGKATIWGILVCSALVALTFAIGSTIGGEPSPAMAIIIWLTFVLIPSHFATAYAFHRLGDGVSDGETRCRKCNYILRGLTEPRSPECGEAI